VDTVNKKLVVLVARTTNFLFTVSPWQRPLRDQKTNFRSFINSHSSIIPANVGAADEEILGLTEIVKNKI